MQRGGLFEGEKGCAHLVVLFRWCIQRTTLRNVTRLSLFRGASKPPKPPPQPWHGGIVSIVTSVLHRDLREPWGAVGTIVGLRYYTVSYVGVGLRYYTVSYVGLGLRYYTVSYVGIGGFGTVTDFGTTSRTSAWLSPFLGPSPLARRYRLYRGHWPGSVPPF